MSPVPDKDMMQDYDNGKNIRNCETGKQGNRETETPWIPADSTAWNIQVKQMSFWSACRLIPEPASLLQTIRNHKEVDPGWSTSLCFAAYDLNVYVYEAYP